MELANPRLQKPLPALYVLPLRQKHSHISGKRFSRQNFPIFNLFRQIAFWRVLAPAYRSMKKPMRSASKAAPLFVQIWSQVQSLSAKKTQRPAQAVAPPISPLVKAASHVRHAALPYVVRGSLVRTSVWPAHFPRSQSVHWEDRYQPSRRGRNQRLCRVLPSA